MTAQATATSTQPRRRTVVHVCMGVAASALFIFTLILDQLVTTSATAASPSPAAADVEPRLRADLTTDSEPDNEVSDLGGEPVEATPESQIVELPPGYTPASEVELDGPEPRGAPPPAAPNDPGPPSVAGEIDVILP